MPDVRLFKLALKGRLVDEKTGRLVKYKKLTPQEKRIKDLQRFLEMVEFYIEKCVYVTEDYMGLPLILQESECKKIEWFRYNSMVGSAVRIWEKYPDCSKPPADNPNPLNGLRTLLIWATEELKNAGVNTEQKLKQASEQKKGEKAKSQPEELSKNTTRDKVFICYSHKDEKWLKDLQIHLKPCVRNGSITTWSDKKIPTGSKWFSEIKIALASAKVGVLLVTKDFLASDFIHKHELKPLLKKAQKGKVKIIWIPVRACAYTETPLKNYQAAVNLDKPLANMKKSDRDKVWVKICEKIKKAVLEK